MSLFAIEFAPRSGILRRCDDNAVTLYHQPTGGFQILGVQLFGM